MQIHVYVFQKSRIGVKLELSYLQINGKVRSNQVLGFKRDVVNFLSTLCSCINEKSPIKFPLAQNSRCLIANLLFESPEVSEMRHKHLLQNHASSYHISEGFVDNAKQQFSKLVSIAKENRQEILNFDHTSESYLLV